MSLYLHLVTKITAGPATTCLPILVISAEEVRDKVKIGPLSPDQLQTVQVSCTQYM